MARQPLKSLTESMFYVLLALWRQERCGTEIAAYVRQLTEGRAALGPGTLYAILGKFQEEELIRESWSQGRMRVDFLAGHRGPSRAADYRSGNGQRLVLAGYH